jgi:hypothetical protein
MKIMLIVPSFRRPQILLYERQRAVSYAHLWAYKRNPEYFDFENFGGDCTNFASQVIFAGSGVMNYTPVYGWYYNSSYDRTSSWTGVNFLYDFLTTNLGPGPFAEQVVLKDAEPGDIAQLSFVGGSHFNHSPVIIETGSPKTYDNVLVAAHTDDQDYYPLSSYSWVDLRFIHIKGVRKV